MILSNDELKKIYTGVYYFEETDDGYLKACQYSKAQMEYFKGALQMWYERCDASSGKTIEFITDATKLSFDLPAGRKKVSLYLPVDATVIIKNFEINSNDYTEVKKNEKVLWLGDSITQGYGPLRSAHTYVNVANRVLNYDLLNQGIATLERFCENIRTIVKKYNQVTVIDGFKLVPHLSEYFLDNLHPNQLGAQMYGENLVRAITQCGF